MGFHLSSVRIKWAKLFGGAFKILQAPGHIPDRLNQPWVSGPDIKISETFSREYDCIAKVKNNWRLKGEGKRCDLCYASRSCIQVWRQLCKDYHIAHLEMPHYSASSIKNFLVWLKTNSNTYTSQPRKKESANELWIVSTNSIQLKASLTVNQPSHQPIENSSDYLYSGFSWTN